MTTAKTSVLIVSPKYPPRGDVGTHRILSFARYLDHARFRVIVLTERHPGAEPAPPAGTEAVEVHRVDNRTRLQLADIDGSERRALHYAKAGYNLTLQSLAVDCYADWARRALSLGDALVRREGVDVVLSSFAPEATHRVAAALKRRHPELRWIADMRDEMTTLPNLGPVRRRAYARVERTVFGHADALTTVSRPILDDFVRHAAGARLLFREIRNGFDFALESGGARNDVFTIGFFGSFYGGKKPGPFLRALSELRARGELATLKVELTGQHGVVALPENLRAVVELLPRVPHAQAIARMRAMDALYLPVARRGMYTAKLFEYLGAQRPILALADPDDVAARLIERCRAGYVADPADLAQVRDVLLRAYRDWEERRPFEPDTAMIAQHHRKAQAARLGALIDELVLETT